MERTPRRATKSGWSSSPRRRSGICWAAKFDWMILPSWFDLHGVVEYLFDFAPLQFMDKAHLVGIHEAGIAHHITAVGQIDREHRTASMLDGTGPVVVQIFVIVSPNIATGKVFLNPAQEFGIDGHQVFKLSVLRTLFDHPHLSITIHNLGLDFTDFLIDEDPIIFFSAQNPLTRFHHTLGTE